MIFSWSDVIFLYHSLIHIIGFLKCVNHSVQDTKISRHQNMYCLGLNFLIFPPYWGMPPKQMDFVLGPKTILRLCGTTETHLYSLCTFLVKAKFFITVLQSILYSVYIYILCIYYTESVLYPCIHVPKTVSMMLIFQLKKLRALNPPFSQLLSCFETILACHSTVSSLQEHPTLSHKRLYNFRNARYSLIRYVIGFL